MKTRFSGKKISGIVAVLPENDYSFEETILDESINRVRRLRRIMGFDRRRRVKSETLVTDMYEYAFSYVLDKGYLDKNDIGAVITVSSTPDYYMPSNSNIIHGRMHLNEDVICVDIAQGCAGYIVGLMEAFLLLEHIDNKKVVLLTGDIFNRKDGEDIKTHEPIFGGDAASLTIIENDSDISDIYCNFYTNGVEGKSLLMPYGAYKHPVFTNDDRWILDEEGNKNNGLSIWMDGSAVFNFIMKRVPPMIQEILEYADTPLENIDRFFFHQPNRYILEKLAANIGIESQKIPMKTTEKYGNSNSSTIPVTITDSNSEYMLNQLSTCCLAGFGSGETWASIVMELGNMEFCELITSDL